MKSNKIKEHWYLADRALGTNAAVETAIRNESKRVGGRFNSVRNWNAKKKEKRKEKKKRADRHVTRKTWIDWPIGHASRGRPSLVGFCPRPFIGNCVFFSGTVHSSTDGIVNRDWENTIHQGRSYNHIFMPLHEDEFGWKKKRTSGTKASGNDGEDDAMQMKGDMQIAFVSRRGSEWRPGGRRRRPLAVFRIENDSQIE